MMRLIGLTAVGMGLFGAAAMAQAQDWRGDARDAVVRCESVEGRLRVCPAPGRGEVQLARQLSRDACVEGRTWGRDGRGIWVDGGCRADFVVDLRPGRDDGYGTADRIRCESRDGRWTQCPADGRGAVLVRQLSRDACIRGRTWGTDARGLWVSGGCRAEFEVRGNGWGRPGQGVVAPQLVRCESTDDRQRQCATGGGDVRLVRQLSRSQCVEGSTWGRTREAVWVDRGCRAEFEVMPRMRRWN